MQSHANKSDQNSAVCVFLQKHGVVNMHKGHTILIHSLIQWPQCISIICIPRWCWSRRWPIYHRWSPVVCRRRWSSPSISIALRWGRSNVIAGVSARVWSAPIARTCLSPVIVTWLSPVIITWLSPVIVARFAIARTAGTTRQWAVLLSVAIFLRAEVGGDGRLWFLSWWL
jgi:hypothetical protein